MNSLLGQMVPAWTGIGHDCTVTELLLRNGMPYDLELQQAVRKAAVRTSNCSAYRDDRQSGFGAPANLADWPRQGSNPGPTGFEAKRLSRPVSREPIPLISGRNARFNRAMFTLPGSG